MLKILSAEQIKALDAYTIKHEPVASIDLMERACKAFVNRYVELFDKSKPLGIICGTGNNGGDGLGIARLLHEKRYEVKVWIVKAVAPETNDFLTNLSRLPPNVTKKEIQEEADIEGLEDVEIVIDALFGSGLSRPLTGLYASVINYVNQLNAYRIAVDIPSGVFADKASGADAKFIAELTLSFQLPKLAFLIADDADEVGEWELLDIGLSEEFIEQCDTDFFLTEFEDARTKIKTRKRFSHKGNYGKALLVSGSYGKMGACVLAARATMRSGLGLLTTHIPKCGYNIMQTAVPECMVIADKNENHISDILLDDDFDSIGVGPGIGLHQETAAALAKILTIYNRPMVLDADALNVIAAHHDLLYTIPKGSILTPHPREFERLAGKSTTGFERLEKLKAMAKEIQCVMLLKGAYTAIAFPDGKIYFNTTGNAGMATGGSGDVLTGILTALLAKGLPPTDAAVLGVYLHGLAGNIASEQIGEEALIASDIIEYLPDAWAALT